MKKTLALFLILLVGISLFAGCSNNADTTTEAEAALVGTWALSSATDTDGTTYAADVLETYGMTGEIILNKDKTASCELSGEKFSGTWSTNAGKTVTILLEEDGETEELPLTVDGDTLVMDDEGAITVFAKK